MNVIYVFLRRHAYVYDSQMFGYDSFSCQGIHTETWSVVRWTFPGIENPERIDTSDRIRYLDDRRQFDFELENLKNSREKSFFLIYPYHDYSYISYYIHKAIKKAGFEFCNITETPAISEGMIPLFESDSSGLGRCISKELALHFLVDIKVLLRPIKCLLTHESVKGYGEEIRDAWHRMIGPIKYKSKYNFVTTRVEFNLFPNYLEVASSRNILIHSNSYDEYLQALVADNEQHDSYIVYVDTFLTGHSDFKKMGLNYPAADAEKYFANMNRLFERLETKYSCKTIIAAHPKSEYCGDEFDGREIIKGKTSELIRFADLVIYDFSTCMNLIILFEKDFINYYSRDFFENTPYVKPFYENNEKILGCKAVDISDEQELSRIEEYIVHPTDSQICECRRNYIVDDCGEKVKQFYQVVCDRLTGSN